jgi:hypothetical protein
MQIGKIGSVSGLEAGVQGQEFWDFSFSDLVGVLCLVLNLLSWISKRLEGLAHRTDRQELRGEIQVDFRTEVQKR